VSLRHAVLLGAAVLFLWGLGLRDLWAPDEPYFAEGAREMVVDGQWVVPHVNGVVTTDKPPLVFWLIALFSLPLGGVSEWTARLPSALAGLATVALAMRLGRRWHGPLAGALTGGLLATTFLFWQKAQWCQTDMVLCCLIWAALSAFEAFRSGTASGRAAGLVFWLAAALAVLAKGPVGFLLPLGIALVTLTWDRDLRRGWRFAPLAGPALFALVVGAWIYATEVGGPESYSVWAALEEHFVHRGLEGMHHARPPWYFLGVTPPNLLPWVGLVPGAMVLAWRRRLPGDRMALAAVLFVLIFFSISTEKRELYVLPAFPAFALMAAALVAHLGGHEASSTGGGGWVGKRWLTVGHGLVLGLLGLLGLGVGIVSFRYDHLPLVALLGVAGVSVAGAATSLYLLRRDRLLAGVAATGGSVAVVLILAATFVLPTFNQEKSARPFAEQMRIVTAASRAKDLPVVAYSIGNLPDPLAFYSDGVYTLETEDPAVLRAHLERKDQVFAVMSRGAFEGFADLAGRLQVETTLTLRRRELLLVSNLAGGSRGPARHR